MKKHLIIKGSDNKRLNDLAMSISNLYNKDEVIIVSKKDFNEYWWYKMNRNIKIIVFLDVGPRRFQKLNHGILACPYYRVSIQYQESYIIDTPRVLITTNSNVIPNRRYNLIQLK